MKHEQLGEAIKIYCFHRFFLGEAIANSLLAGAPPMIKAINQKKFPSICINPKRELHR
jgi:hypothetical protein